MKRLLFLILLTPLVQAKWIDENNYKISSFRLDANTKFDKYCIDNKVVLIANRGVNQIGMTQTTKKCSNITKEYWETHFKGNK
jgi:hypothetical protein